MIILAELETSLEMYIEVRRHLLQAYVSRKLLKYLYSSIVHAFDIYRVRHLLRLLFMLFYYTNFLLKLD